MQASLASLVFGPDASAWLRRFRIVGQRQADRVEYDSMYAQIRCAAFAMRIRKSAQPQHTRCDTSCRPPKSGIRDRKRRMNRIPHFDGTLPQDQHGGVRPQSTAGRSPTATEQRRREPPPSPSSDKASVPNVRTASVVTTPSKNCFMVFLPQTRMLRLRGDMTAPCQKAIARLSLFGIAKS